MTFISRLREVPPVGDATRPVILFSNTLWYLHTFRRPTIAVLQERGHRVVCMGQADGTEPKLRELGCDVVGLPWQLDSMNPLCELPVVLRVIRAVSRERPVAVFSFTIKANLNASVACRICRLPYVTNVSGLGTAFLRDGLRYRMVRRLFGFANAGAYAVFFQNPSDRGLFLSSRIPVGRRSRVLPGSGVDTAHFAYEPPRPRIRTFLMISRLIRDKGVGEYLEAAARLKRERPELRFVLIGPEAQNGSRMSRSEVEAYADTVDYRGETDDVRPALREADCLVLPSYREGMPKTVLEAASVGRPSIVTDVPGCRDAIVPEATGLLCEARSVDDLVRAMRRAADFGPERIQRMSRAARRRAVEVFSVERSIEPYLAILDRLDGRRAAGERREALRAA